MLGASPVACIDFFDPVLSTLGITSRSSNRIEAHRSAAFWIHHLLAFVSTSKVPCEKSDDGSALITRQLYLSSRTRCVFTIRPKPILRHHHPGNDIGDWIFAYDLRHFRPVAMNASLGAPGLQGFISFFWWMPSLRFLGMNETAPPLLRFCFHLHFF